MMTSLQRSEIRRDLEDFNFSALFTDSTVGWDWPLQGGKLRVPYQGSFVELETVAEKRGVKVLHVPADANGEIIASDDRKKLEKAVTPLATEHLLIFTDARKTRQIWLWTSRWPGKPISYRELSWEKGKANELLLQKLSSIAFTLDEEDALDITGVVLRLRDSLDRDKVTKRFYDQFKTHKDAFRNFIKGITDVGLLDWYTSLMLNRLMFCYFLQRKGFLDGDHDYLSNRLQSVREEFGKEKFHSFYKSFLRRLFHEGLGQPKNDRADELKKLIGDIPYLNGGIFEEHKIERDHASLHIPDEAFEKVFAFLDGYDWHLDDRPIASGKEISPEILGYVFEKYTNQKEMGAYYTKEDITDYIAKNCIIPFLLDAVSDRLGEELWNLLRDDPDRYIYPAVGHGFFCDYPSSRKITSPKPLPDYIEKGIDTSKPDLRKRRARWNEPAATDVGLPGEIWRETVARRQRCQDLLRKLRSGEVRTVNDLITLNLNVRQFAQDSVESAGPDLLLALFKAIRKISVLDPACGSGAFLFAALNILEPLYRASLDRMRTLLGDWETRGEKHPNYRKEFTDILSEAALHPNENYFIFKSIIVHNLYGVDIMEEAVEICKLRLFLKLAAQLEPGQEIEPLPDIDFNIRAGNTLVGYATREEVQQVFTSSLKGIEHTVESFEAIEERAVFLDNLFRNYQNRQAELGPSASELREAKELFEKELSPLRSDLNHFLAADYSMRNVTTDKQFKVWQASYRPFHWFVEFYGILNRGGFDVIIGNPPFVENTPAKVKYTCRGFDTVDCGNLYAFMAERSTTLLSAKGSFSFVMPSASICTPRMAPLVQRLRHCLKQGWISVYDERPSKLFDGVDQQLSIHVWRKLGNEKSLRITAMRHWLTNEREALFATLRYASAGSSLYAGVTPKIDSTFELDMLRKLKSGKRQTIGRLSRGSPVAAVYYRNAGGRYWRLVKTFPTYFRSSRGARQSTTEKALTIRRDLSKRIVGILNSTLFYWFWRVVSNCRHLTEREFTAFPIAESALADDGKQLDVLADKYETKLKNTKVRITTSSERAGDVTQDVFYVNRAKSILDEIDERLAHCYDLTQEELDFIINYDIKYRMGLTAQNDEA